jgi:hypothetical protein
VRVSKERILECLQSKLEEQQQCKKDSKMIKKYKMVKFFGKISVELSSRNMSFYKKHAFKVED